MKMLLSLALLVSAPACRPTARPMDGTSPATLPSAAPSASTGAGSSASPVTHDLGPLGEGAITVRPGERLTWSYRQHASVGYGASHTVSNAGVVRLVDTRTVYEHPEHMQGPMTGGDAATGTFVFEAVAAGEAVIELRNDFRGQVEKRVRVTVTVR